MNKANQSFARVRLADELTKSRQKYAEAMRGRLVPTPKAMQLQRDILRLEDEIKQIDIDAVERLH